MVRIYWNFACLFLYGQQTEKWNPHGKILISPKKLSKPSTLSKGQRHQRAAAREGRPLTSGGSRDVRNLRVDTWTGSGLAKKAAAAAAAGSGTTHGGTSCEGTSKGMGAYTTMRPNPTRGTTSYIKIRKWVQQNSEGKWRNTVLSIWKHGRIKWKLSRGIVQDS